jgi:hypothetical protein
MGLGDGPSDPPIVIYDSNGNVVPMTTYGSGDSQYTAYPPDIFINIDRGDSTETFLKPEYTSNFIPIIDPVAVNHSPIEIVAQFDAEQSGPQQQQQQQQQQQVTPPAPAPVYSYQAPPGTVYGPPLPEFLSTNTAPTSNAQPPIVNNFDFGGSGGSFDFYAGNNGGNVSQQPPTNEAAPDRSKLAIFAIAALFALN